MLPGYSHREVHASPLLADFRSNLPAIDEFLCVNILTVTNQSFWYLLVRGHNPANPAVFITLPPTPIHTVDSACATFGHNIYVLGGSSDGYPTNIVQILDARLRTWEPAQRMNIPRQFASAGMIGGRMYIVGGSPSLTWWAEAFDPMSRQWFPVPWTAGIPGRTIYQKSDGRFLLTDNGGLLFVAEDRHPMYRDFWSQVKMAMGKMAVLNGVLYMCQLDGYISGYELATNYGFVVQGLNLRSELLPDLWKYSWMTKLRGMLCVVWKDNQMINCIGIQVTRTRNEMALGFIAWRERVALPTEAVNGELEYCGTLEFRSP